MRRVLLAVRTAVLVSACLGAATVVQANLLSRHDPDEAGLFAAYARLSLELAARFQAEEPVADTRIVLGPGGRDVRLSGELSEGAADRLRDLLDANPLVERIHLTSEGGFVDEGAAIGDLIAARGLTTYVPDYCVSACTLAFVRGRERLMVGAARLGFHGPYEVGLFGQAFAAQSAPERAAYLAAGLAPDFVDAALRVRADDLWIPEPGRLIAAGVATGLVDTSRFPDSTLDEGDDAEHARAAILRNLPLLDPFARTAPRFVERVAQWYLARYREGLSESEAVAALKRITARAVARAMRGAHEAVLLAFGRRIERAMARAEAGNPAACAAIGAGADLVLAQDLFDEDPFDEALFDKDNRARGETGSVRLVERALAAPLRLVPEADARTIARDAHESAFVSEPGSCADLRRAYGGALARPSPEAAEALRRLIERGTTAAPSLEAAAGP